MVVLDTNVLSEAMKSTPAAVVARWMARERGRVLFTIAVSEAEIIFGIAILPDSRRKRELVADRRRAGRPIEGFDAQIAAITRSRGMALATRDVQDFASTGVQLIDPWQP